MLLGGRQRLFALRLFLKVEGKTLEPPLKFPMIAPVYRETTRRMHLFRVKHETRLDLFDAVKLERETSNSNEYDFVRFERFGTPIQIDAFSWRTIRPHLVLMST
jgi:hypothetical protein